MYPKTLIKTLVDFAFSEDPISRFCVVGIMILIAYSFFQWILLSPMKYDMKKFGRDVYQNATKLYFSVAWFGWIFVFVGALLIEMVAIDFTVVTKEVSFETGVLLGILLIVLGILINTRNFLKVYLTSLREKLK